MVKKEAMACAVIRLYCSIATSARTREKMTAIPTPSYALKILLVIEAFDADTKQGKQAQEERFCR